MTQILINLKDLKTASAIYNNIARGAGVVALTDSSEAATPLTFEETLPPILSFSTSANSSLYGYEEQAVEDNWYTADTVAQMQFGGSLPAGEVITSIKFFGGANQTGADRSTDVTINSITKTHNAASFGAAPIEWSGTDLDGLTVPFNLDWVRSAGASYGYAAVIEITTEAAANTLTLDNVLLEPASGKQFVTIDATPDLTYKSLLYGTDPAAANPDQLESDTVTSDGKAITLNTDGTFSIANVGTNVQTFNYRVYDMDGDGWSAMATATVTPEIPDSEKPVIEIIGEADITLIVGTAYTDQGANVTDNVDADAVLVAQGSVVTTEAGVNTLTYDYTDAAGNVADTVTRTVTMVEPGQITGSIIGATGVTPADMTGLSLAIYGTAEDMQKNQNLLEEVTGVAVSNGNFSAALVDNAAGSYFVRLYDPLDYSAHAFGPLTAV